MSAPILTDQQRREMVRLYRDGLPVKVIADRYGVGVSYPSELAKRHGYQRRERRFKFRPAPEVVATEERRVRVVEVQGMRISLPYLRIQEGGSELR